MKRIPILLLGLAALLAFPAPPVRADIAPEPEFGQSLAPRVPCRIAMAAEEVKILLRREDATVEAVFDLVNHGDDRELEVGFPDAITDFSLSREPLPDGTYDSFLDFKAAVDGEEVAVRRGDDGEIAAERRKIRERLNELPGRLEAASSEEERQRIIAEFIREEAALSKLGSGYPAWLLWTMSFAKGQTRRVKVTYRVPWRPTYGDSLLQEGSIAYILKTGAGWEGPIGRAVIRVRWGEGLSDRNFLAASPEGFKRSPGGFEWVLEDFEPDTDIAIRANRYADASEAADGWLAAYRDAPPPEKIPSSAWALASAATCLEDAGRTEECLARCREILEIERAARARGWSGLVRAGFRTAYVPWETRIVRCLVRLGRTEEARAAAAAAVPALEALLARGGPEWWFPKAAALRKWIDSLRAFADGGPAPD